MAAGLTRGEESEKKAGKKQTKGMKHGYKGKKERGQSRNNYPGSGFRAAVCRKEQDLFWKNTWTYQQLHNA